MTHGPADKPPGIFPGWAGGGQPQPGLQRTPGPSSHPRQQERAGLRTPEAAGTCPEPPPPSRENHVASKGRPHLSHQALQESSLTHQPREQEAHHSLVWNPAGGASGQADLCPHRHSDLLTHHQRARVGTGAAAPLPGCGAEGPRPVGAASGREPPTAQGLLSSPPEGWERRLGALLAQLLPFTDRETEAQGCSRSPSRVWAGALPGAGNGLASVRNASGNKETARAFCSHP